MPNDFLLFYLLHLDKPQSADDRVLCVLHEKLRAVLAANSLSKYSIHILFSGPDFQVAEILIPKT